jgi:hypothetical protein
MTEKEWLQQLKPGDRVIVEARWQNAIMTVDRLTKTQIILKNRLRFRKSDGGLVGGDSYNNSSIHSPSKQRVGDIMHSRACEEIGKVKWKMLSLETLDKVLELVE